ncbi:hypothetical protein G6F24_015505 [Rhizopus arrhizus]|nr:hypothetical protein G6F24_015505 [Rhizopus arrhizus]
MCSGSILRATMLCSPITMAAPATTGSAARCGTAPCPPTPSSTMVTLSEDAMVGPSRSSRWPCGWPGMLCIAKMASQGYFVNSPSSIMRLAPPRPSSAGWKIRLSVPSNSPCRARWCAAANSMAVWPSWPQACMTPSLRLAWSRPVASWIGKASMSARSPRRLPPLPRRNCPTTPVPPRPRSTS